MFSYTKKLALAGITLSATIALAACSSTTTPPDTSLPPPLDCGAGALMNKVGQPVTGTTAQDVRVGGQPIATAGAVRVIAPGQPVTQDYRPDRLNLEVNDIGNLVRPFCG